MKDPYRSQRYEAVIHKRISSLCQIGSFLALIGTAGALELPIPNPDWAPSKKAAAGATSVPAKWQLKAGKKSHCTKWIAAEQAAGKNGHTAIAPGTTLSCQLTVPELTEKEQKASSGKKSAIKNVRDAWSGLLSFDHFGTLSQGRSQWKLELLDAESGKTITSLDGKTNQKANPAKPRPSRSWRAIPAQTMHSLAGKTVELKLSISGNTPVVLSGVSFSRLAKNPNKALFGKANGGLGPDLLGAGSLGFDALTEHRQRVLCVLSVRKDSPAAKAGLVSGDQIIGVNTSPLPVNNLNPGWEWFHHSHEATLGRAVASAWSARAPVGKGIVNLIVLRQGKPTKLSCKLQQPMDFASLSQSKHTATLQRDLLDYLCQHQKDDGSWGNPIRTSFAALALLATHDPKHADRVKKAVDWFMNKYPEPENYGGLGFWHASYAGILYTEYHLATGDTRVLPYCSAILNWILSGTHTSKWGMPCLGHGIGGLPYGQKALVAPASHALVFEALAERCGIRSNLWNTLLPYMEHSWSDPAKNGHGSLGYNASYKDKHEFWSRSGLFSIAAQLRGDRRDMSDAMITFMQQNYPWMRNSHAYGEPGGALGLLALNLCRPEAFTKVIDAYGWWFALAWQPGYGLRFTTPHMGAPYMGTDDLMASCYALVLAAPRKTLHITGGSKRNWLNVSQLPTPLSPVITRRNRAGDVRLSCRIPGPPIHYTLDGSTPNAQSPRYQNPIPFAKGGTLKACAIDANKNPGEINTVNYGPAKAGWKILSASGHQNQEEAIRRAGYAIDHSPSHSWLTDVGQDAVGYPHHIVIDLGKEMTLNAVKLHFLREASAAAQCTVKTARDATTKPQTAATASWDDFKDQRQIKLNSPIQARYLRLDFSQAMKTEAIALMIREIDVE